MPLAARPIRWLGRSRDIVTRWAWWQAWCQDGCTQVASITRFEGSCPAGPGRDPAGSALPQLSSVRNGALVPERSGLMEMPSPEVDRGVIGRRRMQGAQLLPLSSWNVCRRGWFVLGWQLQAPSLVHQQLEPTPVPVPKTSLQPKAVIMCRLAPSVAWRLLAVTLERQCCVVCCKRVIRGPWPSWWGGRTTLPFDQFVAVRAAVLAKQAIPSPAGCACGVSAPDCNSVFWRERNS